MDGYEKGGSFVFWMVVGSTLLLSVHIGVILGYHLPPKTAEERRKCFLKRHPSLLQWQIYMYVQGDFRCLSSLRWEVN